MSPTDLAVQEQRASANRQRVVNDFSIQIATVNGSGSQTANMVLLRSILLMGVPVSGKNMFPSNIAGLPTWYTIRASKRHYIARKKEVDLLLAADVAAVVGANRVPRGQPGDVRREEVLARDGYAHLENRTQEYEIRRLAARSVDRGDLNAEVVDDTRPLGRLRGGGA